MVAAVKAIPPSLVEHLERGYDQSADYASRSAALGAAIRRLMNKRREVDDAAKDDEKTKVRADVEAWVASSGEA